MKYKTKFIFDTIWGDVEITSLGQMFIDTQEFNRLKFIKQLGPSMFVFPSAESSRFSHSICVGFLALLVGRHLQKSFPELVDNRTIELLHVSGLMHDIGHGPFSHALDLFVKESKSPMKLHENRSKKILKFMVNKYNIPLNKDEIEFICETFDPSEKNKNIWKYQIISGVVDVDRFDYILRDSRFTGIPVSINVEQIKRLIRFMRIKNNELYFDPKAANIIKCLLTARKELFVTVYKHKTSLAIEVLLKEIFQNVSIYKEYNLMEIIEDVEEFLKIDDSILQKIYFDKRTKHIKNIINLIYSRNFDKKNTSYNYKLINPIVNFDGSVDKNIFYGI